MVVCGGLLCLVCRVSVIIIKIAGEKHGSHCEQILSSVTDIYIAMCQAVSVHNLDVPFLPIVSLRAGIFLAISPPTLRLCIFMYIHI